MFWWAADGLGELIGGAGLVGIIVLLGIVVVGNLNLRLSQLYQI